MRIFYSNDQNHPHHKNLINGLVSYNDQVGPSEDWEWIAFYAEDESSSLIGGLHGHFEWDYLAIKRLWVDDNQKRKGLGTELLRKAEHLAKERGKKGVWLDTFEFQAKEFYEKNGYYQFGQIENAAGEYNRYFMRKEF